jgi:N6-L-threonylcarbamoyladenine synthase
MVQRILGLESSCDETAASVVTTDRQILSNVVHSQLDDHRPYGGVVPEIAARAHVATMDEVVAEALKQADCTLAELDAIAVTSGPGLIGGVIVGVMTAKALAAVSGKPLLGINHLEGHALSARLTENVDFPFLLLLMSGGHCQILRVEGVGRYTRMGGTLDDAAGEAFDKVAKMLGMPYPGGPQVERAAREGDASRFALPAPMVGTLHCDFSFSGLKSAVLRQAEKLVEAGQVDGQARADLCAAFQASVGTALADRLKRAYAINAEAGFAPMPCVVAGGVAANGYLRGILQQVCTQQGVEFIAPPMALCTDNAAMIAWAAAERINAGLAA